MAKVAVKLFGNGAELVAEPALWVVGIWQDRGSCRDQYRGGLVVDTEDC